MNPEFLNYIKSQGWNITDPTDPYFCIEHIDGSKATGKAMAYVVNSLEEEWTQLINDEIDDDNEQIETMRTNGQFVEYKIIVKTQEDKEELQKAFKHFHDSDIDTQYLAVNQLAHEYQNDNIVVMTRG